MNGLLKKESLNGDGNQFHQQKVQSPLIITELTEHKENLSYDVENLGPGIGLAQKCSGVRHRLMGSQHSPINNWIANGNTRVF